MRIVLDTNVVVSALLWRGTPHRLLRVVGRRNDVKLVSSFRLLQELADVLTRPGLARRLEAVCLTLPQVLADYVEVLEVIEPLDVPRVVPDDADDDHVIAAAICGGARLVVSGDAHLLTLGRYREVSIVTAAEAFMRLSALEQP